jgi:hypothetical protein
MLPLVVLQPRRCGEPRPGTLDGLEVARAVLLHAFPSNTLNTRNGSVSGDNLISMLTNQLFLPLDNVDIKPYDSSIGRGHGSPTRIRG